MLNEIGVDVRHAVRTLIHNPGFAATAILTLTLGIGANTAIFTLTDSLILAQLPVPSPERLIEVSTLDSNGRKQGLSVPAFQLLRQRSDAFSGVLAWLGGGIENVEMNGASFAGSVDEILGDYYPTLAISPAIGRFISVADIGLDSFTPSAVAVISYRCWKDRYSGDPNVLGKYVMVQNKRYTIIGVNPKRFSGLIREAAADVTVPATFYASSAERLLDRKSAYWTVIGRLRDGVSPKQAEARLAAIWPAIRATTAPETSPQRESFLVRRIQAEPASRGISYMRERFTRPLFILSGAAGMLLLLACVNLANVSMARAHGRAGEFSLRSALGASRSRLLRAVLVESLLLAITGIVPGLILAYWGSRFVAGIMWQGYVAPAIPLEPDTRVLLFATLISVCAGLLFGLLPAWRVGNQEPGLVLQRSGKRVSRGLGFTGRALVAVQIALSFAIITGALLLSASLANVLNRDPGFSADRLLVAQLFPRSAGYQGFDKAAYFRDLLSAIRSIPGVTTASLSHNRPIAQPWRETLLPANLSANYHIVAPGFFDTLGMRILQGRDFDDRDADGKPRVAIINTSLARKMNPSGRAVGARVRIGQRAVEWEIVAVVSDANLDDPRSENAPHIYVPFFQEPGYMGWSEAIIRTDANPALQTRALREAIEHLGREYPLRIETVAEERDRSLTPERILALLSSFFGIVAALLASVGLYGLLAYTVGRRTAEIGIRVALGASPGSVIGLLMREVLWLLGIGLAVGLAITFATSRVFASLLYGLSPNDPMVLGIAGVLLAVTAGVAAYIPVVRVLRVDPALALRWD